MATKVALSAYFERIENNMSICCWASVVPEHGRNGFSFFFEALHFNPKMQFSALKNCWNSGYNIVAECKPLVPPRSV